MGEPIERFPLFCLGLVLLPGEVVPLHIFEQRYRLMIGACLEHGTEFGVLWGGDDGLRDIGCAASVTQLLERMEDGRMNVLVEGTRPFRLDRRIEDMAFPAGDVELLDDLTAPVDAETGRAARRAYADLVEQVTDTRPSEEDLAELNAYGMASTIAFEPEQKQELLELRSETDRLDSLAILCGEARERFDRSRQAASRAQTNGRVPH